MADAPESTQPIWRWHFRSVEQLRAALEEYSIFQDGTLTRRYGEGGGGGGAGDGDGQSKQFRIMRQNHEIDRRLELLDAHLGGRWAAGVIDRYFRQGLCCEHTGWARAAAMCGLPHEEKSRWDYDRFERHVALCVDALFYAR